MKVNFFSRKLLSMVEYEIKKSCDLSIKDLII